MKFTLTILIASAIITFCSCGRSGIEHKINRSMNIHDAIVQSLKNLPMLNKTGASIDTYTVSITENENDIIVSLHPRKKPDGFPYYRGSGSYSGRQIEMQFSKKDFLLLNWSFFR